MFNITYKKAIFFFLIVIIILEQNNESDSIDEASDSSDADDDHHHTKTFTIPEDRRSWRQSGLMLDDDVDSISGMVASRRNAVSARTSGEGNNMKKQASKSEKIFYKIAY